MADFSTQIAKLAANMLGDSPLADRLLAWSERAERQAKIHAVCQQAMHKAQYDPLHKPIRLTDVGLMVYHAPQSPIIIRNQTVKTDARWLRPFVEVRANKPIQQVKLDLAIVDDRGTVQFTEGKAGRLRGKIHYVTQNWLPLQNLVTAGRFWSLAVYLDGYMMALHRFEWERVANNTEIREQIHTDGEITSDLQQAVQTGKFRKMSLDELLADQE